MTEGKTKTVPMIVPKNKKYLIAIPKAVRDELDLKGDDVILVSFSKVEIKTG